MERQVPGVMAPTTSARAAPSVPTDPVSARAFLQHRVSVYLGLGLALWGMALVGDALIRSSSPHGPFVQRNAVYFHALHAGVANLAVMFTVTRLVQTKAWVLRTMETFATFAQSLILAVMLSQLPLALRPEILSLFGMTLLLVLRASLVPGRPLGAFVIGAACVAPSLVLTNWLYSTRAAVPGSGMDVRTAMMYSLQWACLSLVATTSLHAVIYGLQERVQELGQYTLLHKIGEGGMGVVYRARHALLRRPTAVKVLPAGRKSELDLARFEREVQLTAELAHPNIVSVYDFGRSPDGSFYYAMELLDGIDLQRLVEDHGPLPPARVVHLLTQAADALADAHEIGLIHRDIKPANLLVSDHLRRPDHLTVLDFGLAKDSSRGEDTLSDVHGITGTPLYMAPEAILEGTRIDGRLDVYALGVVAYWLLTASVPFTGRTVVEICAEHLYKPPESPSVRGGRPVPPDLERLVLDCLAKKPEERPDGASDLLSRLRAVRIEPWSPDDARAWWAGYAQARATPREGPAEALQTLTIARRG